MDRLNRHCAYFPCHECLEDCTFCYCPFYPCLNERLGRYVYSRRLKKNIWSCANCGWIHKTRVVDNIFGLIRLGNIAPCDRDKGKKAARIGIIILGHGSKLKQANQTILKVIRTIRKRRRNDRIEPAYLQLSKPALHTSVKKLVGNGYKKIIIVPFFLFAGNHVSRDIPKIIAKEASLYKEIKFVYARNIGQDPRISGIVLDCIEKAL